MPTQPYPCPQPKPQGRICAAKRSNTTTWSEDLGSEALRQLWDYPPCTQDVVIASAGIAVEVSYLDKSKETS